MRAPAARAARRRAPTRCGSARSTPPARACCAGTATCVGLSRELRDLRRRRSDEAGREAAQGDRARRAGLAAHDAVAIRPGQEPRRRSARASRPGRSTTSSSGSIRSTRRSSPRRTRSTSTTCCSRCSTLFDDAEAARHALRTRFRHVLVDEFQDTNRVQYELVRRFARGHPQPDRGRRRRPVDLRVARRRAAQPARLRPGLPRRHGDQARAELPLDPDHPRRRQRDHPQEPRPPRQGAVDRPARAASRSRSTRPATSAARRTSSRSRSGGCSMRGRSSPSDVAVLYRTNAQSRVLEEHLRAARVPAKVVGAVSFFERKEVKDVIAYLRLLGNPAADSAFERMVNVPARGLGETTVDRLRAAARASGAGMLDAARLAARGEVAGLGPPPRKKLHAFVELIDGLRRRDRQRRLGRRDHHPGRRSQRPARQARGRRAARESRDRLDNLAELVTIGVGLRRRERRARSRSMRSSSGSRWLAPSDQTPAERGRSC